MKCSYCRQSSTKTDSHGNCPFCGAEYNVARAAHEIMDRMNAAIVASTSYADTEAVVTHFTDPFELQRQARKQADTMIEAITKTTVSSGVLKWLGIK